MRFLYNITHWLFCALFVFERKQQHKLVQPHLCPLAAHFPAPWLVSWIYFFTWTTFHAFPTHWLFFYLLYLSQTSFYPLSLCPGGYNSVVWSTDFTFIVGADNICRGLFYVSATVLNAFNFNPVILLKVSTVFILILQKRKGIGRLSNRIRKSWRWCLSPARLAPEPNADQLSCLLNEMLGWILSISSAYENYYCLMQRS